VRRLTARVAERVTDVYVMLVSGLRYEQIVNHSVRKWSVTSRTVDTYIAMAKERLEEEAKIRRGVELGKAIARIESQYFKADARKDHRGAMMIEREHIDLLGLRNAGEDDVDDLLRFLDALEGGA
jgi:hypothetical protein